jgi:hypothetical protein
MGVNKNAKNKGFSEASSQNINNSETKPRSVKTGYTFKSASLTDHIYAVRA